MDSNKCPVADGWRGNSHHRNRGCSAESKTKKVYAAQITPLFFFCFNTSRPFADGEVLVGKVNTLSILILYN